MISRRHALSGAAAIGVGVTGSARAALEGPHAELPVIPSPKRVTDQMWRSPPRCYFTYPHSNGFLPSGHPVIAQLSEDGKRVAYLDWDFRAGTTRTLYETNAGDMYWDVAERTGELFLVSGRRRLLAIDTNGTPRAVELTRPDQPPDWKLEELLSVDPTGRRILFASEKLSGPCHEVQAARIFEFDRATGRSTEICDMPFNADHQHYCPFDSSWIGFAHEGDIRRTLDRVWGLHRNSGPLRLWDEKAPDTGVLLAGHERWAFHRAGALVVAYSSSPGKPQGLYFVDAPSRSAALVSESQYDWHCNISRDGRWAVVDTKPPSRYHQEPDGQAVSDIVLVEMATGRRRWLARSYARREHPWHPHPHFLPDGLQVIFNNLEPCNGEVLSFVHIQQA